MYSYSAAIAKEKEEENIEELSCNYKLDSNNCNIIDNLPEVITQKQNHFHCLPHLVASQKKYIYQRTAVIPINWLLYRRHFIRYNNRRMSDFRKIFIFFFFFISRLINEKSTTTLNFSLQMSERKGKVRA